MSQYLPQGFGRSSPFKYEVGKQEERKKKKEQLEFEEKEKGFYENGKENDNQDIDMAMNLSSQSKDQKNIAKHYNAIEATSMEERENSKIIESRKLHNWIKSVLISLFVGEDSIVLDIGGGKGGDLFKYNKQNISELVLVDHAIDSLKEGMNRYNDGIDKGSVRFPLHLICCDAFNKNLDFIFRNRNDINLKEIMFDVVSSQFVIHYAFESKARVLALLHNVTKRLRNDGYFIGTTPDANVIIKKWRNVHEQDSSKKHSFGNENYRVTMDTSNSSNCNDEMKESKMLTSLDEPFGIRYLFGLYDAINNCPEYLLHFPNFVKMASQEPFNLELELEMNFHQFFVTFCDNPKYNALFKKFMSANIQSINDNMWDIAYLYKVFAFRKRASKDDSDNEGINDDSNVLNQSARRATRLTPSDIIIEQ